MQQYSVKLFPSGDSLTIAQLALMPRDLSDSLGLVFEDGCDDLDYYEVAALREPSVGQILLLSYKRTPAPGTLILVDRDRGSAATLETVLQLLGLRSSDVIWTNEQLLAHSR